MLIHKTQEFMMAKPLYSHEEIIAAGESLDKEAGGNPVEPWEVFRALGARGKFDRVRDIWENHVASRSSTPSVREQELPAEVDAAITRALEAVGAAIRQQFIEHASGLVVDHVHQMRLAQKQHAEDIGKLEAQLVFWRDKALASEESEDVASAKPEPKTRRRSPRKPKQTTSTATGKKPEVDEEPTARQTQDTDTDQPKLL